MVRLIKFNNKLNKFSKMENERIKTSAASNDLLAALKRKFEAQQQEHIRKLEEAKARLERDLTEIQRRIDYLRLRLYNGERRSQPIAGG